MKAMPEALSASQKTRLSVIVAIPSYNEGQFIAGVVSKAKRFADGVIVIDDGSSDDTSEAAKAAGATVIKHDVNKGYGAAIKSCFEAARLNAPDVLVTLDGDGQHDPDDIPRLLAPIARGEADVVVGSRFLSGKSSMPRYRKLGIGIITFLYNFGARPKISDAQSGFRAYSQKVLNDLMISLSSMGASVEVMMKVRERGFRIQEVAISCIYHPASHSLNPVTHGLGVALVVSKLRLGYLFRQVFKGG